MTRLRLEWEEGEARIGDYLVATFPSVLLHAGYGWAVEMGARVLDRGREPTRGAAQLAAEAALVARLEVYCGLWVEAGGES